MLKRIARTSRRDFLKGTGLAAAAVAFPYIIPGRALGLDGHTAPSNRITLGFIGVGKMGKGHVSSFLEDDDIQIIGIADVEKGRREGQAKKVDEHYAGKFGAGTYAGCANYNDFRELCARPDLDAVLIATPNQWHALAAIEAAKQGKDIYLEKPLTRTVAEGQAIIKAVRRYGVLLQVGSQQRSDPAFLFASELVRNGRIGKISEIYVNISEPPDEGYDLAPEPTPEGLDWDFWLGPAPWRPYSSVLAPPESFDGWPSWRYYRDYAGGGMDDFGAHHFDIAQWGIGRDGSGPVEVIPPDGKDVTMLTYVYEDGIRMYRGFKSDEKAAVEWIGEHGSVMVNRGQFLRATPESLLNEEFGPGDTRLYKSDNHKRNWIDGIKTRREPICPVEVGHSTNNVCQIGNIAYWLKRPLKWDPVKEAFVKDSEANRLLSRPMRAPWHLS
jgi:predicted dehydrogenase